MTPMPPTRQDLNDAQWVMVGVPLPEGRVMICASRTLSHSDITAILARGVGRKAALLERPTSGIAGYVLAVAMYDLHIVQGATYAEALRDLLKTWNPDAAEPDVLEIELKRARVGPLELDDGAQIT